MSFTIALINGKGGVGKTTVSLLLALAFRQAGRKVALIDHDPQKSATTFAGPIGIDVVEEAPADAAIVVIDTPPNIVHPLTLAAVRTANLVVLVTTPSPTAVGATAATARLIQGERKENTVILFNNIRVTNRFAAMIPTLTARLPFPVLQQVLYQRTGYEVAQLEGWKAIPAPARVDVLQLARELIAVATPTEIVPPSYDAILAR